MDKMYNARTDLAVEANAISTGAGRLDGVTVTETKRDNLLITIVEVVSPEGERQIGKPMGKYITVECPDGFASQGEDFFDAARAVAEQIKLLMGDTEGVTLVAGLGNRAVTPDAVGPKAGEHIIVTRHLFDEDMRSDFAIFNPVCAITPGVLGITGMETGEILKGVVDRVKPNALIAIDALCSRSMSRLCKTIQMTDTGIVPGSGIGNSRAAITPDVMGVPVIAVGVPTVVDAMTIAADIASEAGMSFERLHNASGCPDASMIVTPKDIDRQIDAISRLIGYGINMALHNGLDGEEIASLLS